MDTYSLIMLIIDLLFRQRLACLYAHLQMVWVCLLHMFVSLCGSLVGSSAAGSLWLCW